jgi:hypothetical protein
MLEVLHTWRLLRLTGSGRLVPWLGPALRGLIGRRLKTHACLYTPAEQEGVWRCCRSELVGLCPHHAECPYGQTLEGEPADPALSFRGHEKPPRPIVIAPDFPLPRRAHPGLGVPVRVSFLGQAASRHAVPFWEAAAAAGTDPQAGLGPDAIGFHVEPPRQPLPIQLSETARLPALAEAPGVAAFVRVQLAAPLIIREDRRLATEPSLGQLLAACLRSVGTLCRLYGQAVPDEYFVPLRERAAAVPTVTADFRRFFQPRWSNRTEQHREIEGVIGSAVYADVPAALVCWLAWGGRLHVGGERVAGAGGWRVHISSDARTWQPAG